MKNIVKLVAAVAILTMCSNLSAQNIKLAHINLDELIMSMPESDSLNVKIQKIGKELEEELDALRVEYNKKLQDYVENRDKLTDLVRGTREQDLNQMNQRMQLFQENAQEQYQVEYNKLLQPILEKANKAIETVAKEQGITYVMSANPQVLLFKAVGTLDLLPAVKQHLGIDK